MQYLGIDPGVNGASCLIKDDRISVKDFDKGHIGHNLYPYYNVRCWIERVWGSPNQSPQTAFSFGKNYGYWLGRLEYSGIKFDEVTPYEWQSQFISNFSSKSYKQKKKDLHQLCIKELEKNNFSIKVNQKQADAVLIALALRKHTDNVTNCDQHDPAVSCSQEG